MTDSKKRIVLIEDHPTVRERLAELINKDSIMEVCGEAEDARAGLDLIRNVSPDLAIIDLTLKNSSGLDLVKQLRGLSISIPVLIFSMHNEAVYAQRALRAGANGYINKNRASQEVIAAVHKVLSGEIYLSQEMTSEMLKKLAPIGLGKTLPRPTDRLSDRELTVLEMIGEGHGTRAIAESLGVGVATVETYRARIKEKMNLQNTFDLLHFAIRWVRDR